MSWRIIGRSVLLMMVLASAARGDDRGFVDSFNITTGRMKSSGQNRYFVLEPGSVYEYAGLRDGAAETLVITVTKETKTIDGVETRVVEARKSISSKLTEVAKRFLAIDSFTKEIYCYGEAIDVYKDDQVINHDGSWQSGDGDAKFGLFMPARPKVGSKFYQKLAPSVAMDRCEVTSTGEKKQTSAGMFEKCLRVVVTTPLAAEHSSFRYFAPGVGMIAEDEFELVKYPKSALAKNGKGVAPGTQPVVPIDQARAALDLVGADPVAESVWVEAINDPNLSDHDRQDLIEDLNENGFADPHNLTADDLPLVLNRLDLIDQLAPDAMDQVNSDAFDEAYKDLNNMLDKLTRP